MDDRPLISVITPFLDEISHLDDCIRSVAAQTCPRWEHLLVDDGTTDASAALARRRAEEDDRVRVLTHPGGGRRGRSAARNLGLEHARGEYVVFLDADDVLLPFKLERHLALLEGRPDIGMVTARFLHWHSPRLDPRRLRPDFVSPLPAPAGSVLEPPELLRALLRDEDVHPANNALLVRTALCRAVGGFDAGVELYEDTMLLARIALRARVLVSGDCSSVYRLHPDSTCFRAEVSGDYHPDAPNPARRGYLESVERQLAADNVRDEELLRLLRRELGPYRRPRRHALRVAARAPFRRARAVAMTAAGRRRG